MEAFKKAIYEEYGRKFPLSVRVWTLPEKPNVDGRITGLQEGRILVVDDKKTEGENPFAMWLGTGIADAVIVDATTGEAIAADRLRIGYRVRAWSENIAAASYPGQSGLMRLEVTSTNSGPGDLEGTLENKGAGVEDTTIREVQIDGTRYPLLPSAVFWIDGREGRFEELREGDRVRVWFAGYEAAPGQQIATQIAVPPVN